jgi:glycosyltransferase involved in cell wall biosynthesis
MLDELKSRYVIQVPTAVILNAPTRERLPIDFKLKTVRTSLNLQKDTPLHVYVGILAPKRGLHTAIQALALAPNHHVAIVTRSRGKYFEDLVTMADQVGVSSRLHWLPYVPADYVSTFISDASSGLATHVSVPAHEVSLGTKIYEYVFAGIPILSSDGRFRTQAVSEFKLGEIFAPEDPEGLAKGMLLVSSQDPAHYKAFHEILIDKWCWETQATKLLEIYRSIM